MRAKIRERIELKSVNYLWQLHKSQPSTSKIEDGIIQLLFILTRIFNNPLQKSQEQILSANIDFGN